MRRIRRWVCYDECESDLVRKRGTDVEDVGGQRARRCHLSFERFFLNLNSTKLLDQLTGILPFHLRQEDPDPTKPTKVPRRMYHVGSMFSISVPRQDVKHYEYKHTLSSHRISISSCSISELV